MMSNGTAMQWMTFAGFAALLAVSLWAGWRRPSVRPWALGVFMWAANNCGFYTVYLIIGDGVLTPFLIEWSALTRMHGIFLTAGALLIAAAKRTTDD